jgi:hypothetical protein
MVTIQDHNRLLTCRDFGCPGFPCKNGRITGLLLIVWFLIQPKAGRKRDAWFEGG